MNGSYNIGTYEFLPSLTASFESSSTMRSIRSGVSIVTIVFVTIITTTASIIKPLSSTASGAFTFTLGNVTYYSPASSIAQGSLGNGYESSCGWLPLTLLRTNETAITSNVLADLISTYASLDDVWTEDFLGGALALLTSSTAVLDASAICWIASTKVKHLLTPAGLNTASLDTSDISKSELPDGWDLRPGPYSLSFDPSGATVREVYAVHRDNYEAFLYGVTPVPESSAYEATEVFIPSYQDTWIPVPSRLYWLDDQRPLAGLRIGLKDIYNLEGVQTGGGSRSYAEVYPVANTTAVSVQKLLDTGAVVIVSIQSAHQSRLSN